MICGIQIAMKALFIIGTGAGLLRGGCTAVRKRRVKGRESGPEWYMLVTVVGAFTR
ncbi:predicted protein [Plenodomus lingam JN3]|uniref:Predicted protein n=1 Tax=Leptosphaeria maculans (strain JN3 / isolate v23.1.3 / race Av1-4-5-6-7-8) TaxID=985895 RepID=E5ABT2_LEPMJ|nr:predicted protein [Plenodomus lingam JN3]CBY01123.1 predicted protein [Plenodomus lingam JN3]